MNKIRKTATGVDCPIILSEEFITVDEDNALTAPIMTDKDILKFVQSSINIIDADSDDENKSSCPRIIQNEARMRSYLDTFQQ
ncbi:hypothetical protein TNCV_2323801 [Trichonephila clavipes]|nr:hypothetical protein TNCV_2323801 [Trichonephila clavipes]